MLRAGSWLAILILLMGACLTENDVLAGRSDSEVEETRRSHPKLFLIGGNADCTIGEFVRLAGGAGVASVAVITLAGDKPEELADSICNSFSAANVRRTFVVSADDSKASIPKEANAVYIGGGNESRLMRLMTPGLIKQLCRFHGIIGANSAAAMAAPSKMISGGLESGAVRAEQLKLADGMGLVPNILVDSHVGQRNRDARCMACLGAAPDVSMVIGLDEDTAVFIEGRNATVFGTGHARVYQRTPAFSTNLNKVPSNAVANVRNASVSYLCHGDTFQLPATASGK